MSLEIAIQENTKAIQSLIALISIGGSLPVTTPAVEFVKTEPAKTEKRAKTEPVVEQSSSPESAKAEPVKPEPEITYDDLKSAVLKLATKDRTAVLSILGEFGVKNAKDLKPEQYAGCLVKVNAALVGAK